MFINFNKYKFFFLIIGILFTEIHSGNLLDILEHKFVISYPVETLDSCNSASRNERTLCSAHHDRIFLIRIYQETFHITSEGITKDAVLLLNFLSFNDLSIVFQNWNTRNYFTPAYDWSNGGGRIGCVRPRLVAWPEPGSVQPVCLCQGERGQHSRLTHIGRSPTPTLCGASTPPGLLFPFFSSLRWPCLRLD